MNLILSRLWARLHRKVAKNVKKSRDNRRFALLMLMIALVVPVLPVEAAPTVVAPLVVDTPVSLNTALELQAPTLNVQVRTSPRQLAKKAAASKQVAAKVATVTATDSEKREWVKKAADAWGIDWKVLEAVWQVESGKQFYTATRSYAGAQGPCQFMPGTWRAYGQDGNGDGVKDILDARDCLFGAAKLLASNGASSGNVNGALLRYNHSLAYVAHVLRIAAGING